MRKGLYVGSFDPFTEGHGDIVHKALEVFDEVIIAIAINTTKTDFYTVESRKTAIEKLYKTYKGVKVIETMGLVGDTAKFYDATIVRGIRDTTDAAEEIRLARINRNLFSIETAIFVGNVDESYTSSSLVRELVKYHKLSEAQGFLEYKLHLLEQI